jgi:hypothetical protein
MRQNARMAGSRVRTADYSATARQRLGDAALKAREALGMSRPAMVDAAAAAGIKLNKKSIELIETGQPGVGQSMLYALGRFLPNWTEDTPRIILESEDGPIPPTATALPAQPAQPAAPYEFSAEARARMISMTMREVLAFVEHELISRGEEAADRAFDEIARVRREARQIQLAPTQES